MNDGDRTPPGFKGATSVRRITLFLVLLCLAAVAGSNRAISPPHLADTLSTQWEIVEANPLNAVAWNDYANLLALADRTVEAEKAYRRSLELVPRGNPAHFNLALLLHQTGRLEEAEQELRALLEDQPHHAWGHYQLGMILAARRQRDQALVHYAQALAYDPSLTFAENNPHIIDNPLFGEALLMSHRYADTVIGQVPRHYGDADRIAQLMLGPVSESDDDAVPTDDSAAPATGDTGGSAGPGMSDARGNGDSGAGALGGASSSAAGSSRLDTSSARDDATAGVPAAGVPAAGGAQPPRGGLVLQPSAGGSRPATPPSRTGESLAPSQTRPQAAPPPRVITAPPARGVAPPPTARPASPPSRPGRQPSVEPPPSPPGGSRYIPPSRRSSAQLELRLLPEESVEVAGLG